tara:strand:+ start:255 stop:893 length:639 start_codon:yes stop_codon:yes gene_type:complete
MAKVTEVWITPNALDVIAYCARVSNPGNQENKKTAPKLLNYLKKHKHWSPFEMASMCVEIETTRDIAHQIVRHRSFSFQEFSQRYANVDELGSSVTYREARMQDESNRQNSIRAEDGPLHAEWRVKQENTYEAAKTAYRWAIDNGIAKEQARVVLPEGMTDTRLYMSGTIRSWIHYVELREANGTQKEHQEIAKEVRHILTSHGIYKASYEI